MEFVEAVEKRFQNKISMATEGLQIAVLKNNHVVFKKNIGKTYKYYDLASLTKILYTVSALQLLNEFGLLKPEHYIMTYFPEWKNPKTQIKHLLTHSAGLDWWKPYYKDIPQKLPIEDKKQFVYNEIIQSKSILNQKSQYSDLDFILLNALIEKVAGMPSDEFSKILFQTVNISELFFQKNNQLKFSQADYAPTEKCPWRKKQIHGEVHDDNAWAMGGVSGHAGLFGSIEAVIKWAQCFYEALHSNNDCWARSQTIGAYTKKVRGDWAMGYMMPTKGRASCGRYFSSQSIGHTGFVGTSFWHDPKHHFAVIVLSNRVYPSRDNPLFVKLRPILHDVAFEFFNS